MKEFKYLQKLFFLLVMGFALGGLQACSSDDDETMDDPSSNTKDIAVTGEVQSYGCTTADITGYVNLNQLFPDSKGQIDWGSLAVGSVKFGVEVAPSSGEESPRRITSNTLSDDNRTFTVKVDELLLNTEYKYRTFVQYGGIYHYGEHQTFTTKDIVKSGAVDLGLSVKWAACNVGASSPQGYGGYYAWGETAEKSNYSWENYKWSEPKYDRWGNVDSYDWITKYCTDEYYGYVDNKTTLALTDDVARVKLGGSWRIPTKSEFEELIDKCTWVQISYNDVDGRLITGPNGNSIFLPAAGYREYTSFNDRGSYGYYCGHYWSATLEDNDAAFILSDDDGNWSSRYCGCTVRPVKK